jgi:hypothetical protein
MSLHAEPQPAAPRGIPIAIVSTEPKRLLQLCPPVATVAPECPIGRVMHVVRSRLSGASARKADAHAQARGKRWFPAVVGPSAPAGLLEPGDAVLFSLAVVDKATGERLGETASLAASDNVIMSLSRAVGDGVVLDVNAHRFELRYRKESTFG